MPTTETPLNVAQTIFTQIPRINMMRLGASMIVGFKKGLQFKVGGTRKTTITIFLNQWDLYDVEVVRERVKSGVPYADTVLEVAGVYNDGLGAAMDMAEKAIWPQ